MNRKTSKMIHFPNDRVFTYLEHQDRDLFGIGYQQSSDHKHRLQSEPRRPLEQGVESDSLASAFWPPLLRNSQLKPWVVFEVLQYPCWLFERGTKRSLKQNEKAHKAKRGPFP